MVRSQHHIHPLRPSKKLPDGGSNRGLKRKHICDTAMIRVIPNACRARGNKNECKHEAPWTNRLNHGPDAKVRLICPGIAKKRKLRCSGARNAVGQALMLRNSEWLDGTMPGLCIAFGGSNTDVSPNDRLPIFCLRLTRRTYAKKDVSSRNE